jgi:tetratricopeptide (TPR) repeat protein
MRLSLLLLLLAAPAAAQACPKGPDNAADRAAVIADMQKAKTAAEAAGLMTEFWMIQMRAPDAEAQAMLNAAVAQRNQGDVQGSLDTLNGLVETCPDFIEGYNQRAFDEYLLNRNAAALADADHVLAQAPDHIGALSGKALVLMRLGRLAEAQQTLRAAVKLDPWLPERRLLKSLPGQSL